MVDMVLESLERSIVGRVIRPGDADFDDARQTFNATVQRHPTVIVQPDDTASVVATVRAAIAAGLPISVRGGGHSVAGHAMADGAVCVDLRRMRGVSVDPVTRRATVQGGAVWEDVDRATMPHDLATTGGTFWDTGVGGLSLSGGIGYLMGTSGLTCDNVLRATVVTAAGEVVEAGPAGDPELLWRSGAVAGTSASSPSSNSGCSRSDRCRSAGSSWRSTKPPPRSRRSPSSLTTYATKP